MSANKDHGYGWKCLTPYGSTQYKYNDKEFYYPLPQPEQTWGEWIEHPEPAEPDGKACGPGRLHVMRQLSANYAPGDWYPWFVEWEGLIGERQGKIGVRRLRLCRLPMKSWWHMIRRGKCAGAILTGATLRGADLTGADLTGAILKDAILTGAYLGDANLTGADLTDADLKGAILTGAYLTGADLTDAILTGADLTDAILTGAYLRGANLRDADLTDADLTGAYLRGANLRGAYYQQAIITDVQRKLFEEANK